jgi:formyltetrahydrofolate synthetase
LQGIRRFGVPVAVLAGSENSNTKKRSNALRRVASSIAIAHRFSSHWHPDQCDGNTTLKTQVNSQLSL